MPMSYRKIKHKSRVVETMGFHNGMASSTKIIKRMVDGEVHVGTQSNATHARHLMSCVMRLYKDIEKWEAKRNGLINTNKRAKLRELIFRFNLYADLVENSNSVGCEDILSFQKIALDMQEASY